MSNDGKIYLEGFTLEHPLMNAAGTCKTLEEVQTLAPSMTAAVVVGSGTLPRKDGNSGQVYQLDPKRLFSLNSIGLRNGGKPYYSQLLRLIVQIAHDCGKPLIFSAAGNTPEEYVEMAEMAAEAGVDLTELNLGCPNKWGPQGQMPIASFDFDLAAEIIGRCHEVTGKKYGIKVNPYSDPSQLSAMARVITTSGVVIILTTVNTFPNAFGFDEKGKPLIQFTGETQGKLAGLGGPAMKPIGLGQVLQFRAKLPQTVQIFGVGGISSGRDIWEYLRVGAVAVQIGTAYIRDGRHDEHVFERMMSEYLDVVEELGEPGVFST